MAEARGNNVRHVIIKDSYGEPVLELPVRVGVLGFLAAPKMAALGAFAAIAGD